jgi:hypothetical protein
MVSPAAVLRRVPDRPVVTAVVMALLAVGFVGSLLLRADGDVSRLVHAAPPWTDPARVPGSLKPVAPGDAFDGQFFYRLGVAPFATSRRVAGVRFDLPALRNARWLYRALAWATSGGDRDVVPWALVGINVVAAGAVGFLAGALARASGRHAGAGLLIALYPGFAYSLSLDTSELVAAAFLLAGLLALRRGRASLAALAFTGAVLTRDTAVVVPFGVAVAGAWPALAAVVAGRRRGRGGVAVAQPGALWAGTVPLVAFGAWQLVQRVRFGALPVTSSGNNNLSAPLRGLVHELRATVPPGGGTEAFRLLSIALLVGALVAAAAVVRRSRAPAYEKVALVPAAAVVVLLNPYLWSGATAFMRAGTEAYLLAALVLLGGRPRWTGWCVLPVGAMSALTMVAQLGKVT